MDSRPEDGDDPEITEQLAFTRGERGQAPMRPPEAIKPYVAGPVRRRRRSDWPVLLVALVVAGLVMGGCCIAGFAFYVRNGGTFP